MTFFVPTDTKMVFWDLKAFSWNRTCKKKTKKLKTKKTQQKKKSIVTIS